MFTLRLKMHDRSKEIGAAIRYFGLELPTLSATNVHSKVYGLFNGGGSSGGWMVGEEDRLITSDRFDEALHENGIVRRSLGRKSPRYGAEIWLRDLWVAM